MKRIPNLISEKQYVYSTGKKKFTNTSLDEKVAIVNKAILNIFHNFILHETLLVDDKDPP